MCFWNSVWMFARGWELGKYLDITFLSGNVRLTLKSSSPKLSSSVEGKSYLALRLGPV